MMSSVAGPMSSAGPCAWSVMGAGMPNYPSGDVHETILMREAEGAFQHDCEFVELRFLAGFNPAARAAHVGHAEARLTGVHPANEFIDQFWFVTRGSDAGRGGDEFWHGFIFSIRHNPVHREKAPAGDPRKTRN